MIFPVGGRIIGMNFYVSNATWTRPENCTSIIVVAIGGGGGGFGKIVGGANNDGLAGGSTSFGPIISCGGGGGGFSAGNGNTGTVTTSSNVISIGGNKFNNSFGFLGYGNGGAGGDSVDGRAIIRNANGGGGGFAICLIKENLLNSYAVTIGAGGAGGVGTGGPSFNGRGGENGNAGAVLVIEFGG